MRTKAAIRARANQMPADCRGSEHDRAHVVASDWRGILLEALAEGTSVAAAARRAGVSRQAAYRARGRDRAFAARWGAALVRRRAQAIDDPVAPEIIPIFHGGLQVGFKVRDDSAKLLRMLRGAVRAGARIAPGSTIEPTGLPQFGGDVSSFSSTSGDTCGEGRAIPKSF